MNRPFVFQAAVSIVLATGVALGALAAEPARPTASAPDQLVIDRELTSETSRAEVRGSSAWSANGHEEVEGERVAAIFLHPPGSGRATMAFEPKMIESGRTEGENVLLLVRIGFRDGVPWGGEGGRRPNGVRFIVTIDDDPVLDEELRGPGLRSRAIDLAPWIGKAPRIAFHTEPIRGDSSWDWALFAEPWVARVERASLEAASEDSGRAPTTQAREPSGGLKPDGAGVLLVRVVSDESSRATIRAGDAEERIDLRPGTAIVPLHLPRRATPAIESDGKAVITSSVYALHAPRVAIRSLDLSSPLVTIDRAFHAVALVENEGRGTFPGGEATWRVGPADDRGPYAVTSTASVPELAPGEETRLALPSITLDAPGPRAVTLRIAGHGSGDRSPIASLRREVVVLAHERDARAKADDFLGDDVARIVWAGRPITHGILEVAKGGALERVGSLFPLIELVTLEGGERRVWPIVLDSPRRSLAGEGDVRFEVRSTIEDTDGRAGEIRLEITRERSEPRFHIRAVLEAKRPLEILRFAGPSLLAGDRSFGARKHFAIFPGLEVLEDDEPSSSTRDLAPPLNDRRAPPPHTITTPLIAVQANDALVSLHWPMSAEWARGEKAPAAFFSAPDPATGIEHIRASVFVPSIGRHVAPNETEATEPFRLDAGERVTLRSVLVIDSLDRYPEGHVARGPHRGGLALQAFRHHFELFGFPSPAAPPRDWESEKTLSLDAWRGPVFSDDPPGFRHCAGWAPGPFVGHALPILLSIREGVAGDVASDLEHRVAAVLDRALRSHGPGILASGAGCHILEAEMPFLAGHVAGALGAYLDSGRASLAARRDGLWRWRPASERHRSLGTPGDHTLGVAAHASWRALRAARLTGDPALREEALAALGQLERYEVPRGAQMWECPLYQPDILAAAHAIRAYVEAFRLTGDERHLDRARYWAWFGLPFLYTWELPDRPTMRWNVIAVIGSTFYTHSWIGLPVVWCGLVYAYALQELADAAPPRADDLPWRDIARGITVSALHQQYASGPHRGTYPDSWNLVENRPNPADLNPENILMNALRLRGAWGGIRSHRFETPSGIVFLNTPAKIASIHGMPLAATAPGDVESGADAARRDAGAGESGGSVSLEIRLEGKEGQPVYALLAPVARPRKVEGAGDESADESALVSSARGWTWSSRLRAIVLKVDFEGGASTVTVEW